MRSEAVWPGSSAIASAPPPVKMVSDWFGVCVPTKVSLPIEPPSTLPATPEPEIVSPTLPPTVSA